MVPMHITNWLVLQFQISTFEIQTNIQAIQIQ